MSQHDCIFCQIVAHKSPAQIECEDDDLVVIKDIHPSAPVHLLIIPKKHVEWNLDLKGQEQILGRIFVIAPQVADRSGVKESGYKLVLNCGRGAGQIVDHFHIHLMGGWQKVAEGGRRKDNMDILRRPKGGVTCGH